MTRHSNTDLVISAGNSHDITEIVGLIVDLDVFVQELFLEMTRKQLGLNLSAGNTLSFLQQTRNLTNPIAGLLFK